MAEPSLEDKLRALEHKQKLINDAWAKTGNKELLSFFVELMPKALQCERCSIFILDPKEDNVWVQVGTGLLEKQINVPQAGSLVGEVISSGQRLRPDFQLLAGAEFMVSAGALGGYGAFSPLSGVAPKLVRTLYETCRRDQFIEAREAQAPLQRGVRAAGEEGRLLPNKGHPYENPTF